MFSAVNAMSVVTGAATLDAVFGVRQVDTKLAVGITTVISVCGMVVKSATQSVAFGILRGCQTFPLPMWSLGKPSVSTRLTGVAHGF